MPQAILKFKLPEELEEFETTLSADDMSALLFKFDQWLRSEIKHNSRNDLQEVRDKLYELANEHNISIS
jgi:hypothetical protein